MKKENIALVIFLVFIFGAGAYFYSLETVPQNVAGTNPPVVHRESQKGGTINLPPTAGNILGSKITKNGIIATYENLDWGFSIKYPSSYIVRENKISTTSIFSSAEIFSATKYTDWDYSKGPLPPSFRVGVEKQTSKVYSDPLLYAKDRYSGNSKNGSLGIKIAPLKINNTNGAEILLSGDGEEGKIDEKILVFIKNSFVYSVKYNPSNDGDYKKITDSFVFVK